MVGPVVSEPVDVVVGMVMVAVVVGPVVGEAMDVVVVGVVGGGRCGRRGGLALWWASLIVVLVATERTRTRGVHRCLCGGWRGGRPSGERCGRPPRRSSLLEDAAAIVVNAPRLTI